MLKMLCFRIEKKNDGFCRCSYMYNCINNNNMVFRKDTDLSFVCMLKMQNVRFKNEQWLLSLDYLHVFLALSCM